MIKSYIVKYLQEHQYAKRADLLEYLYRVGFRINDRMMRKIIEELVMNDGMCIASTDHGYRLIGNESQLEDAVEYLRKKAKPISIRANQLINNYQKTYKTQLMLSF